MSATAPPTAPPTPPVPGPLPRTGDLQDVGAVRRESVRAHRWSASGAVKVLGDVEVDEATLAGLTSIRGNLSGGSVGVSGTCDVLGSIEIGGTFRGSGTTNLGKGLRAAAAELSGATMIHGPVAISGSLRWTGTFETTEGIAADRVEFEGRGTVPGAIVTREVDGRIRGDSHFGSITADRVRLIRPRRWFDRGALQVLTIEAKDVELEAVVAQYVKADHVAIGPNCQIAQVDGTITRQHPTAHVGPASRSPPPYGLMR